MKIRNAQVTAFLTALATAAVTIAQAAGVHITTSTGHTALVAGIVSAIATLLHGTGGVVVKATSGTLTMYDTTTLDVIPPQAAAVAGYVNGRFANYGQVTSMFPRAKHVSISVTSTDSATCLDVETGDATPESAARWVIDQHARGLKRPWIYCNKSTLPSVTASLKTAGISRSSYVLWIADPTNRPHIVRGADATQWGWHALGRNLDVSLVKVSAFE